MPEEEPAEDPAAAPLFRKDTAADKAVRFGCGAILGALVAMAGLMTGLAEPFGMTGVIVGIIVVIGGAGLVCVTHGEPAVQVLLKLIKWLA